MSNDSFDFLFRFGKVEIGEWNVIAALSGIWLKMHNLFVLHKDVDYYDYQFYGNCWKICDLQVSSQEVSFFLCWGVQKRMPETKMTFLSFVCELLGRTGRRHRILQHRLVEAIMFAKRVEWIREYNTFLNKTNTKSHFYLATTYQMTFVPFLSYRYKSKKLYRLKPKWNANSIPYTLIR